MAGAKDVMITNCALQEIADTLFEKANSDLCAAKTFVVRPL